MKNDRNLKKSNCLLQFHELRWCLSFQPFAYNLQRMTKAKKHKCYIIKGVLKTEY